MNAAETSASNAMADCTLLTVVSRSSTTAEIDTFINDVSTTRTNIAIDSRMASRMFNGGVDAGRSAISVTAAHIPPRRVPGRYDPRREASVTVLERRNVIRIG